MNAQPDQDTPDMRHISQPLLNPLFFETVFPSFPVAESIFRRLYAAPPDRVCDGCGTRMCVTPSEVRGKNMNFALGFATVAQDLKINRA